MITSGPVTRMLRSGWWMAILVTIVPMSSLAQRNPTHDEILGRLSLTPDTLKGPVEGIRPVAPPSRASGHTSAIAGSAAQPAMTGSVDLLVEFRSGSAELTPDAVRTLNELGQALTSLTLLNDRFRIEGHTDTVGSPEANKILSEQRSRTVAEFLETRFGLAARQLDEVGVGSNDLAVATGPQVPEARNRRVKIINLGS